MQAIETIQQLFDVPYQKSGRDYIAYLIQNIAKTLGTKVIIFGTPSESRDNAIQTEFVWKNNEFSDNFQYDLAHTPCEQVLAGNRVCIYPDNVQECFPKDDILKELNARSYLGSAVLTMASTPSSILVLLDDKPIADTEFKTTLIELLSARVSAEFEKHLSETRLKKIVAQRTSELAEAIKEKDKLFSIVSHDIKNALNAQLGLSELMMSGGIEQDSQSLQSFSQNIFESATNINDLLNNLLYWSSSQGGNLKFNPGLHDIGSLITTEVALLEYNASFKNINLSIESGCPTLKGWFDKNMISLVLRNLLSNAIKFTQPQGQVVISHELKDGFVVIKIIDSGIGMSDTQRRKVLEESFIGTSPETNGEKGVGLGLLLCKEFVQTCDGTLCITSKVGEGSCISFSLPLKEPTTTSNP